MTFVSLFAGIGGFDLGLERAGLTCVGQVEIDPYALRVLEKRWPTVPKHQDVRTFKGDEFGHFDVLVGGYPCQPFSHAGQRRGEHDERHLWPEVLRIIRAVRPRYALLENVPGHLSLGFGRVLGDLAESGYDAEWDCVPASAVGAPHRRDRVFILAYPNRERAGARAADDRRETVPDAQRLGAAPQPGRVQQQPRPCRGREVADATCQQRHVGTHHAGSSAQPQAIPEPGNGSRPPNVADTHSPRSPHPEGQQARTPRSAAASGGGWWDVEPDVGRVVDGVPARVDRLRTLGNAVVPQVAEHLGRRLMAAQIEVTP